MFSRVSLRTELLASYLLLLTVSLGIMAMALLVFTGTRAAPPESTFQRLAALVQGLNARDVLREFAPQLNEFPSDMRRLSVILDGYADTRSVRVMWIYAVEGQQYVLYDSHGTYDNRALIRIENASYVSNRLAEVMSPRAQQLYGSFYDPDGSEWLFGGITRPSLSLNRNNSDSFLLLAEPRPTISLQQVLSEFSGSLLPPLLQAALVCLGMAFLMAALMTRSLSKPLQALARGATAVARGDYGIKVPVTGPAEIRAVADSFNFMSAEVRATQQSQRDFLANVSHDLKTPLTSIQGYSQAIMDGATKDPAKAASIIYDEAGRLNRMVMELTDLMRMQSGRLSLNMTALDISQMAEAIAERLKVVADRKQISLRTLCAPLPMIAGDGDRLAQVLTNLLSNAITHTPRGGIIWLKTQATVGGVEIIVRDTGEGIPAQDLPRIFERFYQVDKARGPGRGSGLGLAITQEIVLAHGGTIRADSPGEGQGATFRVFLPLSKAPEPDSRR